mmetsp:Transcript_47/g.69  ORF Transcript_47/g.69 Transcript_47/m.69 type:complete len:200 (+) Transcript_47:580-1179(+)
MLSGLLNFGNDAFVVVWGRVNQVQHGCDSFRCSNGVPPEGSDTLYHFRNADSAFPNWNVVFIEPPKWRCVQQHQSLHQVLSLGSQVGGNETSQGVPREDGREPGASGAGGEFMTEEVLQLGSPVFNGVDKVFVPRTGLLPEAPLEPEFRRRACTGGRVTGGPRLPLAKPVQSIHFAVNPQPAKLKHDITEMKRPHPEAR